MNPPTCVDLFCGAGGFSLGFRRAGLKIEGALDANDDALETYDANFEVTPVNEDISEIEPDEFLRKADVVPDDIDVVVGGPPCKGFSTAGMRDPEDPRNKLINDYIDFVTTIDPEVVVTENVTGILSLSDGKYAQKLVDELGEVGYHIGEPHKVSASSYGVPQLRTRVLFMGSKKGPISPPDPEYNSAETKDGESRSGGSKQLVTTKDALSDLETIDIDEEQTTYSKRPETEYQKIMREGSDELFNHKTSNHGSRVQKRFGEMEPGSSMDDLPEDLQTSKHSQQRLHPERPSPTVTTLPDDLVHYADPRIPTVRELARLQSFPDSFEFKGPRTTGGARRKTACPQYSQVGNAVPPLMAEEIAYEVKTHLS